MILGQEVIVPSHGHGRVKRFSRTFSQVSVLTFYDNIVREYDVCNVKAAFPNPIANQPTRTSPGTYYQQGFDAFNGSPIGDNPYHRDCIAAKAWRSGWLDAEYEMLVIKRRAAGMDRPSGHE